MILLPTIPLKDQAMSASEAFLPDGLFNSSEVRNRLAAHRDDPVVQRALEIIWTQTPFPASVDGIARQLPVTRRTLDRRFVEAIGHSVLAEINACRLQRAKRLLTESELPVKTVAHVAGFTSTERMRVLFIEREGISPLAYRKRAGQKSQQSSDACQESIPRRDRGQ
jgi:transcriptional regulator GlxA family with amidase domain